MNNTSYILVCDADKTFTSLNRFDRKRNTFEGEYSLLHNTYTFDAYFLSRFLLAHVDHPLRLLPSGSDRYHEVIHSYQWFQKEDIDRYIEEKLQEEAESEHQLETQRSIGQLQLLIAKQMIEKERERVQNRISNSEHETYVLLGQDYAFRWSIQLLDEIVAQGNV